MLLGTNEMPDSFREYLELEEQNEYEEFCAFDISDALNEGILSRLSPKLKKKIDFVKQAARAAGENIKDVFVLFKNTVVFKFFQKIGWNFLKLFKLIKQGFKLYNTLLKAIAQFVAKNPVTKWTDEKLKELDAFLKQHPRAKKIIGIGVAALLVYIWFSVGFTGDIETDFDMSSIIGAFTGSFTLTDLFSGAAGITIITLLFAGTFRLGFPWPSSSNIQFISAIIGTLFKKFKVKRTAATS